MTAQLPLAEDRDLPYYEDVRDLLDEMLGTRRAEEVADMLTAATLITRPPVDREALAVFVANAISRAAQQHVPVGYRVADALISAGVCGPVDQPPVMPPVGGQKLALAIYQDGLANGCHQNTIARKLLARYDIRERGETA